MEALATFSYLLPSLSLLIGALVLLLLDLIVRQERIANLGWIVASLSVLAAAVLSFVLDGSGSVQVLAVLTYDSFTAYMWRLILLALLLVVFLSESYIRNRSREPGLYYACLLFFGLGALALASSSNLIMLLLAVDFLSLVGYILTGFLHYDKRSTEAATKYLIYGSALSAVMAYGLSWLYGLAGTADYATTAEVLARGRAWASGAVIQPNTLIPVLIFLLAGFSFKIGSAPFHQWLPDAFEGAPSPVSAALAIVPKLSGFAALVRFTMVLFPEGTTLGGLWRWPLVAFLAIGAMLVGNLTGVWQENIKRLMAYSGIAQVGYALIGVATASERGLSALLLYLTAYTLAEIGAFAAITVMSDRVGLETVEDYRGLYHRAPALSLVLLVSMLSLFGMPGTGGFMGKLWLFLSALEAGRVGLLVVAALNSVLSLTYYWKVIRATFIRTDLGLAPVSVPFLSYVVLAVAIVGILWVGVYPNLVLNWADSAIHAFSFPVY